MKIPLVAGKVALVLLGLGFYGSARAVQMNLPAGNYAKHIGTSRLQDPSGMSHGRGEVAGKVVVAIFSAPNMSQGNIQEKWADLLATNPATKVSDRVFLALVEDMSQAGVFRGMALDSMKQQFTEKSRPFLILDQDGQVFKRFGVPRGTTRILIYDRNGTLRDVELDLSNQDASVRRIKAITNYLLKE